jgi:hypothetical protein
VGSWGIMGFGRRAVASDISLRSHARQSPFAVEGSSELSARVCTARAIG